MAEFDGFEHFGFAGLIAAGFHHDNAFFGADHDDVEFRGAAFGIGGVGGYFAVDKADANGAYFVMERDIRNGECGGGTDDAEHRGILLRIRGEHHGNDLRFAHVALGEQGPHRAVNEAAGEDFLFRRTSFAFDEASGEAPGGIRVFAVIHGEGEKGLTWLGLLVGARGDEHDRIARADYDRAVGLFSQLSGFDRNLTAE